jgi:hypothetical protein
MLTPALGAVADVVAFPLERSGMNGDQHPYIAEPHFWLGRLSRGITLALVDLRDKRPEVAREHLHSFIAGFLKAPVASEELKIDLRGDLKRR